MSVESLGLQARARVHAALGEPARLAIVDALTLGDASPGEIAQLLEMPTNLVAHHVNVLEQAGVVVRSRSEGDQRRTYLRVVAESLAGSVSAPVLAVRRVVFVCTHNSARSQLAAALWPHRSRIPVASAGTRPASRIHPRAVRTARRHGLALDRDGKTFHAAEVIEGADLIVAVCDNAYEQLVREAIPGLHWSVPDPAPVDTDAAFEAAFTDIAGRIDRLASALTSGADDD
jgi:ArsR family transcriptional regulator, arsenate/arsenite/antimonite-responsive transcriptional repressor / arsenate reductase (thioredoxin)